jgi:hypothetical protein
VSAIGCVKTVNFSYKTAPCIVLMKESSNFVKSWQRITYGVFKAQLFDKEQCASMLQSIRNQSDGENPESNQPNSMQEYGLVLNDAALAAKIARFVNEQLKETIRSLFPNLPHYRFSEHHAFLTSYGEDANRDLSLHVDASHLTLNICLESDAQGTDLVFTGARCRQHVDEAPDVNPTSVQFGPGDALLHLGNQRHLVTDLTFGRRHNLIIWYRLDGEGCEHSNPWIKDHCSACQK